MKTLFNRNDFNRNAKEPWGKKAGFEVTFTSIAKRLIFCSSFLCFYFGNIWGLLVC